MDLCQKLELGSDRVIDPALYQMPNGTWRIWYKNERDHSHIYAADSSDLIHWQLLGPAITDTNGEAPKVFRWKGRYFMITDVWKGLAVYSSDDLTHWTRQPENILRTPGTKPTDRTPGDHCDVVLNKDRAFIFYFTSQGGEDKDPNLKRSDAHTAIQLAELKEADGILSVNRDEPVSVDLGEDSPRK